MEPHDEHPSPESSAPDSSIVHRHAERTRLPVWVAVAIAIVCGAGTAVQSRINGELATALADPYAAAAISFGSGLVVLLAALACWRPGRAGFARLRGELRERRIAWWMLLGGLAGAWFVTTQGLSAGVLGVAVFTVAIVAGQTVGGLVFDVVGLGPGGRRRLTWSRVAGALLALGAIGWAVSAQLDHDVPLLLMLLPFIAGIGAAWQQAVNGRVRSAAESALTSTVLNFAVGTTALVVVLLVHAASAGFPARFPSEPWLYLGGVIGCLFIAGQAIVVRIIGVLVLALAGVAGQLSAALALDLLLPAHGRVVDVATIGGTVLALAAVALASLHRTRHRHVAADAQDSVENREPPSSAGRPGLPDSMRPPT
ncbi:EamA-like transporter family protein [Agromyces sp. CFH 90414]|uniref:EamA-like transporter family protein n=1 Tax=Agromyces agglutinans TaxID=2662258 RepID=A0A6I2FGH6_9MICO|nr:DMT family transporter [Agromyces agglutinans]MRG61023.1 EamA-like transporter family protein [Agromyces agglutinans]